MLSVRADRRDMKDDFTNFPGSSPSDFLQYRTLVYRISVRISQENSEQLNRNQESNCTFWNVLWETLKAVQLNANNN